MEVTGEPHAPAALPPGEEPLVPFGQEAMQAPELAAHHSRGKSLSLPGIKLQSSTPQPGHCSN